MNRTGFKTLKSTVSFLLLITIFMTLLAGCGGKNPTNNGNHNGESTYGYDYSNPEKVKKAVRNVYFEDYCFGLVENSGNRSSRTMYMYNTEKSLMNLYMYPYADEELILQTANAVYRIDGLFTDNKEYKKYCKSNGVPYYIDFYCIDQHFGRIILDGNNTLEDITANLTDGINAISETAMEPLMNFYEDLEAIDGLTMGPDGTYAFILDTKNFDESATAILDKINEVRAIDPLSEDVWENYSDSQPVLGYLDKGFSVYADSIGPDNLLFSNNFMADSRYFLIWMFLPVSGQNILDGKRYVHLGSASINVDSNYFYTMISCEEDGSVNVLISLASRPEGEYTREVVTQYAADYINDFMKMMDEHNIKMIKSIGISADFTIADDLHISCRCEAPLDGPYTADRVNELIDEYGEEYDPAMYQLPDDCFP